MAKELFDLYRDQRLIFTEYKKGSTLFTVKKWRQAPSNGDFNSNIVEGKMAKPAKVYRTIIDGIMDRKVKREIIFEDDLCMAFYE